MGCRNSKHEEVLSSEDVLNRSARNVLSTPTASLTPPRQSYRSHTSEHDESTELTASPVERFENGVTQNSPAARPNSRYVVSSERDELTSASLHTSVTVVKPRADKTRHASYTIGDNISCSAAANGVGKVEAVIRQDTYSAVYLVRCKIDDLNGEQLRVAKCLFVDETEMSTGDSSPVPRNLLYIMNQVSMLSLIPPQDNLAHLLSSQTSEAGGILTTTFVFDRLQGASLHQCLMTALSGSTDILACFPFDWEISGGVNLIWLALQLARGLSHLHSHGVCHGKVGLANVFVTAEPAVARMTGTLGCFELNHELKYSAVTTNDKEAYNSASSSPNSELSIEQGMAKDVYCWAQCMIQVIFILYHATSQVNYDSTSVKSMLEQIRFRHARNRMKASPRTFSESSLSVHNLLNSPKGSSVSFYDSTDDLNRPESASKSILKRDPIIPVSFLDILALCLKEATVKDPSSKLSSSSSSPVAIAAGVMYGNTDLTMPQILKVLEDMYRATLEHSYSIGSRHASTDEFVMRYDEDGTMQDKSRDALLDSAAIQVVVDDHPRSSLEYVWTKEVHSKRHRESIQQSHQNDETSSVLSFESTGTSSLKRANLLQQKIQKLKENRELQERQDQARSRNQSITDLHSFHKRGLGTPSFSASVSDSQSTTIAAAEKSNRIGSQFNLLASSSSPSQPQRQSSSSLTSPTKADPASDSRPSIQYSEQERDAELHHQAGLKLFEAGKVDLALKELNLSAQLNPKSADVFNNLGVVLDNLGLIGEAVTAYQQAVRLAPSDSDTRNNLGSALYKKGDIDGSIREYNAAIEFQASNVEARHNLAIALRRIGQLEESIEQHWIVVKENPDLAEGRNSLGNALQHKGLLHDAIEQYRMAISLQPDYQTAYYNLANALAKLNEYDAAISTYRDALSIQPWDAEAHYNLGVALESVGRVSEAFSEFETAVTLNPDISFSRSPVGDANQMSFD